LPEIAFPARGQLFAAVRLDLLILRRILLKFVLPLNIQLGLFQPRDIFAFIHDYQGDFPNEKRSKKDAAHHFITP
jgi:hypothetical protein